MASSSRIAKRIVFLYAVPILLGSGYMVSWAMTPDRSMNWGSMHLSPLQEDLDANGVPFTPSTQSILRGKHQLRKANAISIQIQANGLADLRLSGPGMESFSVKNVALNQLVPRLYYQPNPTPDAFDGFNLMMAEFARNSISVPRGQPGDSIAHFEAAWAQEEPYKLKGDYQFVPNALFRPYRFSVVNNCLAPGLWELSAVDRSGEIYHGWFSLDQDAYARFTAQANGVTTAFAKKSVQWRTDSVPLDLGRLRTPLHPATDVALSILSDDGPSYSSQDSRRKLAKGFVQIVGSDGPRKPRAIKEMTSHPVRLSQFISPGKYSIKRFMEFDLSFLRNVRAAHIQEVSPLTFYAETHPMVNSKRSLEPRKYLEMRLDLGRYQIVAGNLPLWLLVPQEDFPIYGFGVGIQSSGEPAERRQMLFKRGPHPSFAYLTEAQDGKPHAVNSHQAGIEQVYIRTHLGANEAWWEIIVTSYERMADLIKYRIAIPKNLEPELRRASKNYIAPLFRTYRDDNLR